MKLFEEVINEELNASGEASLQLLKMVAQCSQGIAKEEAQAKIDNANSINIVTLDQVFSAEEINEIKRLVRLEKKECYKNATNFALMFSNRVKYCEGIFNYKGIPIDHAFNIVDDKYYVDLTREFVLQEPNLTTDDTYVCFGTYTADELLEVMEATMYYGGVFEYLFRKTYKENIRR